MGDSNFVCRCIVAVLDKALEKASGTQFKVLFFLSRKVGSDGGRVSYSEIQRGTSVGVRAARNAVRALVAMGLVLIQSSPNFASAEGAKIAVPAIAIAAAQLPKEDRREQTEPAPAAEEKKLPVIPHLKEYSAVWDTLRPLAKTIREPLSDSIVRQAMQIGAAWNRNGYQVGAMIYRRTKWFEVKQFGPRKWIYILNGLRMGFESEARGEAEERRHLKAEKVRSTKRVVAFEEQKLTLEPCEDREFYAEIDRVAEAKSLRRAAAAS